MPETVNTAYSEAAGRGYVFTGLINGGVRIFRGIKYASYERFSLPEIAVPDGRIMAVKRGSLCPQRSKRVDAIAASTGDNPCREGELNLTVYSPENAISLPVMVWIHGGSYITGGSEEPRYSGERLVRKGNVVVVKISYRLGASGYLYLPENGIANLGLEDQKAALEWIQRNIPAFGGDPRRVTVFGQSAGAHSLASLIAGGCAGRLFSQAILQSPPLGLELTPEKASGIAWEFCKTLGKDIRCADIEEILDAQEAICRRHKSLAFMPVTDAMRIPEISGDFRVLLCSTVRDASPFIMPSLGRFGNTVVGRLIENRMTRRIFNSPIRRYYRNLLASGGSARRYLLRWAAPDSVLGSCHSIELPFLLGEYEDWKDSEMLTGSTYEDFIKNSETMLSAWTGFAVSGIFPEKLI